MTKGIRIKELLSCRKVMTGSDSTRPSNIDVREEYANAFRTESYHNFWTRVLALSEGASTSYRAVGSTTAERLSSYRLFAQHLLDPDQQTVSQVLESAKNNQENKSLLLEYFLKTANASLLCSRLLKDVDNIRNKYRSIKSTIEALQNTQLIMTRLTEFLNYKNPFVQSAPSRCQIRAVQSGCTKLIKRLESTGAETRAKISRINKIKGGSAVFLVALTAVVTVIIVTHGFALLVATPSFLAVWLDLASTKKLARLSAQLNVAAKGTYILNRDLDTISRLVARVDDELVHMLTTVRFWLARKDARVKADGEIMRQLRNNKCNFTEQLDELEEHLYLCFMTINRARNLVIKEIIDPNTSINVVSSL